MRQKYSLQLKHLLSAIHKAYTRQQEVLIFKENSNNNTILQKLMDDGLINNYRFVSNMLIIFLKTNRFIAVSNKNTTKFLLKKRFARKETLLLKCLTKQHKKGNVSFYYLNTDKGLLSSYEAINNNIGGKFIVKIQ